MTLFFIFGMWEGLDIAKSVIRDIRTDGEVTRLANVISHISREIQKEVKERLK